MTKLTKRQKQVLEGLMNGASDSEIAKALRLKESTAKMHIKKLYKAKGIHDRLGLVVHEYRNQIQEADSCILSAYMILRRIANGSVIHKKLRTYIEKWGKHDNT